MPEIFKCPDCDFTTTNNKALGPHRRMAHGFSVKDGKNDPKRSGKTLHGKAISKAFEKKRGSFPCPHCDFVAQWSGGLTKHTNQKHPNQAKGIEFAEDHQDAKALVTTPSPSPSPSPSRNGNAQAAYDGNHRLEAAATFAAGRITELLSNLATQYDLPARTFAALVLQTVGQASKVR